MPAAAWKKLAAWVSQGGRLIALGRLPANSETEFPSQTVTSLANTMFDSNPTEMTILTNAAGGAGILLPPNMEWLLPRIIASLEKPLLSFTPKPASIKYTHRHFPGKDRILIINDDSRPWEGLVSIPFATNLIQINPQTGSQILISPTNSIPLRLGEYESVLLQSAPLPQTERTSWTEQGRPKLSSKSLPATDPVVGRGEFVREIVKPDSPFSNSGLKAWNAHAEITKSKVDVFLFASFRYPTPLNFANAAAIEFETSTPEQQHSATQLLVIVHEKGGGDFLASTGRSLATPGPEKILVPLGAFQLAGWSSDADGHIDWSRVEEIRIGWGGYLGTQGETVDFKFTEPRLLE